MPTYVAGRWGVTIEGSQVTVTDLGALVESVDENTLESRGASAPSYVMSKPANQRQTENYIAVVLRTIYLIQDRRRGVRHPLSLR